METVRDANYPCSICGKTEFVMGKITAMDAGPSCFSAEGRGMMDRISGVGSGELRARICRACRHVDLFAPDFVEG